MRAARLLRCATGSLHIARVCPAPCLGEAALLGLPKVMLRGLPHTQPACPQQTFLQPHDAKCGLGTNTCTGGYQMCAEPHTSQAQPQCQRAMQPWTSGKTVPCDAWLSHATHGSHCLKLWRHPPSGAARSGLGEGFWGFSNPPGVSRHGQHSQRTHLDRAEAANELQHHGGRPQELPAHLARKGDSQSAVCCLLGFTQRTPCTDCCRPANACTACRQRHSRLRFPLRQCAPCTSAHCCYVLCAQ